MKPITQRLRSFHSNCQCTLVVPIPRHCVWKQTSSQHRLESCNKALQLQARLVLGQICGAAFFSFWARERGAQPLPLLPCFLQSPAKFQIVHTATGLFPLPPTRQSMLCNQPSWRDPINVITLTRLWMCTASLGQR